MESHKNKRWSLYPRVDVPTVFTWQEFERLADNSVDAKHAVAMVCLGKMTHEEALVACAYGLYERARLLFDMNVDLVNSRPSPPIVMDR